jgi:hypothetical protein
VKALKECKNILDIYPKCEVSYDKATDPAKIHGYLTSAQKDLQQWNVFLDNFPYSGMYVVNTAERIVGYPEDAMQMEPWKDDKLGPFEMLSELLRVEGKTEHSVRKYAKQIEGSIPKEKREEYSQSLFEAACAYFHTWLVVEKQMLNAVALADLNGTPEENARLMLEKRILSHGFTGRGVDDIATEIVADIPHDSTLKYTTAYKGFFSWLEKYFSENYLLDLLSFRLYGQTKTGKPVEEVQRQIVASIPTSSRDMYSPKIAVAALQYFDSWYSSSSALK